MEKLESVSSCLESGDPLSDEVFTYLLSYHEEDERIDFKKAFDESEREWLEITKDVISFANSHGGYLVFGIEDASYKRIGLTQDLAKVLTNTNNILQKINRFIEPQVSLLRTKEYKNGGLIFVAWYIPETVERPMLSAATDRSDIAVDKKRPSYRREQSGYVGVPVITSQTHLTWKISLLDEMNDFAIP